MSNNEAKALECVRGGLELLRLAIIKGDPHRELELRTRDLIADVGAIANGLPHIVAGFKRT